MTGFALSLFLSLVMRLQPVPGSLEEAEKNIVAKFNAIQSLAATITNEEGQEKEGKKTTVKTVRQIEWTRKGKAFLYRAQTRTVVTQAEGDNKSSREVVSTTVSDAERVVRISTQDGATTAVQRRAEVTETPDLRAMLERLREDSTLSRFPDVKVGKDECYAIQVVPKEKKGSDITQSMIYFRKDIGLDVLTVVYDKDNKPMFTSTTTNVRVNPELHPDRFVVTIPEGVELVDQTKR